jgi:hypothetical protein
MDQRSERAVFKKKGNGSWRISHDTGYTAICGICLKAHGVDEGLIGCERVLEFRPCPTHDGVPNWRTALSENRRR